MIKHEPTMHFKHDFNNDCGYCQYETADYCSNCGKPLSDNAKALEHKLKDETKIRLEELMKQ